MTIDEFRSRLFRNGTAMFFIGLITLLSLMALFAFFFIPDKSWNSNQHNPQLTLKHPLFSQDCVIVHEGAKHKEGIIKTLFKGKRQNKQFIPYDSIEVEREEVKVYFEGLENYYPLNYLIQHQQYNLDAEKTESSKASSPNNHIEEKVYTVNKTFILGTDKFGRDVVSRLILGLRISLVVGFLAVMVSVLIGIGIGSIGGYFGGYLDRIVMLIINTAWSIPTLLLAFAIIIAFGKGVLTIILAIGLTMWVDVARVVRGEVLSKKNELFVQSARVLGLSHSRIIFKHILPNIIGPILVIGAANFATAILVEAGLSFLGIGVQPPAPSLGTMLKENYAYITGGFVYLALFPILTIMLLVLSFNMIGTSLRDVFDVKSESK